MKQKSFGRINYIEPNDINAYGNLIPHPYEDYNIYVDLEVYLPERGACGTSGDSITRYSTSDGTLSFMNGTDGKLTTNYTDIDLNGNPEKNTSECLGIENLTLSYDANMIPVADIKFVDVRGASFFSKQEYQYIEGLRRGQKEYSSQYGTSFMKAIFSMPSPIFTLTIKGFYGKAVKFKLDRNTVKANFNPSNGNFEVNVQFIGQMYGVYADIPMSYALLAPYIEYNGRNYWKEKKEENGPGAFKYDESGAPLYTFLEFRQKLSSFLENERRNGGSERNKKILISSNDKVDRIRTILNKYEEYLSAISKWCSGKNDFTICEDIVKSGDNISYNIVLEYFDELDNRENSKDAINLLSEDIYTLVEAYKANNVDNIEYPILFTKDRKDATKKELRIKHIEYEFKAKSEKDVDGKKIIDINEIKSGKSLHELFFEEKTKKFISDIASRIISEGNSDGTFKIITLNDGGYISSLKQIMTCAGLDIENINNNIKTGNSEELINLLGFSPTVWNYFKMIFAHTETFIQTFYSCLREINGKRMDGMRSCGYLNLVGAVTDIPKIITDDASNIVPPFPLIYTKKVKFNEKGTPVRRNEIVRPGEKYNGNFEFSGENFPEVKLAEAIYEAIDNYIEIEKKIDDAMMDAKMSIPSVSRNFNKFIPLTLFDFAQSGNMRNPYSDVIEGIEDDVEYRHYIDSVFLMRAFSLELFIPDNGKRTTKNRGEGFGKMDAINFYRAHPKISKRLKEYIEGGKRGFNKAYNYLSGKKEDKIWNIPTAQSSLQLYNGNNLKKSWFGKEGSEDRYFPLCVYSFNKLGHMASTDDFENNNSLFWVNLTSPEKNENCTYISDENDIIDDIYKLIITNNFANGLENTKFSPDSMDNREKFFYFTFNRDYYPKNEDEFHEFSESIYGKYGEVWNNKGFYLRNWGSEPESYPIPFISCIKKLNDLGAVKEEKDCTIFSSEVYKEMVSSYNKSDKAYYSDDVNLTYAKAYMFIMSIPLDFENYNEPDSREFSSLNTRPLVDILQEGAFWWRYDCITNENYEPINLDNLHIKRPEADEFFIIKRDNDEKLRGGFSTIGSLKGAKYLKCKGVKKYSVGRRRVMSDFFKKWAVSGSFLDIASKLEATEVEENEIYTSFKNIEDNEVRRAIKRNNIDKEIYLKQNTIIDKTVRELLFTTKTFIDLSMINVGEEDRNEKKKSINLAYNSFIDTLSELYANQSLEENEKENFNKRANDIINDSSDGSKDFKLQIYLTLKRLYERQFCGVDGSRWLLSNDKSDFRQFFFTDTFYNDIKDSVLLNTMYISDTLSGMIADTPVTEEPKEETDGETENKDLPLSMTIEEFMSSIAGESGMCIKAFPLGNAMLNGMSMEEMFKPKPFGNEKAEVENYFLCIYNDLPSENLNIAEDDKGYLYEDDGFDISDSLGNPNSEIPEAFNGENGLKVPAFGVTFGKQNQSYFTNLSIDVDTYKDTEPAIQARFDIARKGSEGPRETNIYGQNIYSVYSNLGYQVQVEGLGNAQIMPGMLFQLNNIPMFKGTYMIHKVDHSFEPGNARTTFVGTRMKKYCIPFVESSAISIDWDSLSESEEESFTNGGYMETMARFQGKVKTTASGVVIKLEDFVRSNTAESTNTSNTPTEEHMKNIERLINEALIPIMEGWANECSKKRISGIGGWDDPHISITSGYRSPSLNKQVGGSSSSAHCGGNAVDLVPDNGKVQEFFKFILLYFIDHNEISFDQILNETKSSGSHWVHFGYYDNAGGQDREFFNMHNHKRSSERKKLRSKEDVLNFLG